jgi:hypothetical protein
LAPPYWPRLAAAAGSKLPVRKRRQAAALQTSRRRLLALCLGLLRAKRLQLPPLLIESLFLPRGRVIRFAQRRADVAGDLFDFGRDFFYRPATGNSDENQ